jgi:hypothetical protein
MFSDLQTKETKSMTEKKRRAGGGKLARTENVQIRLDPRLRYLAELGARKQRRTLSSFMEWAVEKSLESVFLYEGSGYNDESISVADQAAALWDVDDAERLAKLAWSYPDLLTHEEQVLWKLIRDNGYLWKGRYDNQGWWIWNWKDEEALILPRLSQYWTDFVKVAQGEEGKEILPKWVEKGTPTPEAKKTSFAEFDDDIPF